MSKAESILWDKIHINEWRLKFRRQHPIWQYIADFYCHKLRLVIELDGSIHDIKEVKDNDSVREQYVKDLGITVLRFTNAEVINNTNSVLEKLEETIKGLKNNELEASEEYEDLAFPLLRDKAMQGIEAEATPSGDGGMQRLFVIKIGGNVIDSSEALQSFLKDFASVNGHKILVHGGGKIATRMGDKLGIESSYINGRRITDDETIDIVTMVYGGLVNKKIVAQLQALNCNAIGLTGADANIIPATKRPLKNIDGQDVDFGWVGDINNEQLKINNLELIIKNGITPVFAPLTHDSEGHILNTNADTIASSLAIALSELYSVRLIYCFEKKGVLENLEDDNSVIQHINKKKYQQLLTENKLFEGILPKLDNAFAAINAGVQQVLIGHASDLLKNTGAQTAGTLITG